jgi:hypothetical protein
VIEQVGPQVPLAAQGAGGAAQVRKQPGIAQRREQLLRACGGDDEQVGAAGGQPGQDGSEVRRRSARPGRPSGARPYDDHQQVHQVKGDAALAVEQRHRRLTVCIPTHAATLGATGSAAATAA